MVINKYLTKVNYNTLKGKVNKYIVIHYTANNGDTAKGNCKYFYSTDRGSSAHYFVDENGVWQCVEDKNVAWHCGAQSYKHPYCRNNNSIGIELCSRKDGNYYFKDETVNNAVELVKELMAKYNVPIDNVIRHYDVTGKICPEPFVRDIKKWQEFKERLVSVKEDGEMIETGTITVNGKNIKIDKIVKDGSTFIKLRGLENAGFEVGYDAGSKNLVLDNKINELPVVVEGAEHKLPAVNIKGYNYLTVRSFAELLGLDTEYDSKSGKVILKQFS